jgi:hypothetical protein
MRTVQIDDHTRDRRIRAVEAEPHCFYAIGVERKMLLFCAGERAGKNQDEPVGIDCSFNGRLDGSGQDDLNGDVRAVALHLQLLDFSRAACRALRSAQRAQ